MEDGPAKARPDYAFAVAHGVVRGGYRIHGWEPTAYDRWPFHGELDEELTRRFVDVSDDIGRGTNTVRYINC